MNDINIQMIKLPPGVHGVSTKNEDGSYTVFLDLNDSYVNQRKGFIHEMRHIRGDDFFGISDKNVIELEKRAHK